MVARFLFAHPCRVPTHLVSWWVIAWWSGQDKLYDLVRSDVNKCLARKSSANSWPGWDQQCWMRFRRLFIVGWWTSILHSHRHAAAQQGHLQEMEQKVDKSQPQLVKIWSLQQTRRVSSCFSKMFTFFWGIPTFTVRPPKPTRPHDFPCTKKVQHLARLEFLNVDQCGPFKTRA